MEKNNQLTKVQIPNLLVIPSIDIKDGKTVRVVQGIPELNCSSYGDDPIEMAMIWRAENAKFLHVVDFNCSHEHSHCNFDILKEICNSVIIPVEFGGGISSYEEAREVISLGVHRVVIGTLATTNQTEFQRIIKMLGASKISAAIDVIDNEVVIKGRSEKTGIDPIEYAKELERLGAQRCIITDVKRNGMLVGPNIDLSKQIAENTNMKVTHSGGITDYRDLKKLNDLVSLGIDSAIVGRALYENRFPCQKIWRKAEAGIFN